MVGNNDKGLKADGILVSSDLLSGKNWNFKATREYAKNESFIELFRLKWTQEYNKFLDAVINKAITVLTVFIWSIVCDIENLLFRNLFLRHINCSVRSAVFRKKIYVKYAFIFLPIDANYSFNWLISNRAGFFLHLSNFCLLCHCKL